MIEGLMVLAVLFYIVRYLSDSELYKLLFTVAVVLLGISFLSVGEPIKGLIFICIAMADIYMMGGLSTILVNLGFMIEEKKRKRDYLNFINKHLNSNDDQK